MDISWCIALMFIQAAKLSTSAPQEMSNPTTFFPGPTTWLPHLPQKKQIIKLSIIIY